MSRIFVIGDIHGAYRALKECLERSGFDYQNDKLISLGDVSDGWPQTKDCVDELLKIKNLVYILGNHDSWTLKWMKGNIPEEIWLRQGGEATVKSYANGIPEAHLTFFEEALPYYILNKKLFVHAGIDTHRELKDQDLNVFLWDRSLARIALDFYNKNIHLKLTSFDEVYLGHTPVPFGKPVQSCDVWLMDTGAGWSGSLSMMDVETKEIFMSDAVPTLYPGVKGRSS